jgi:hypothetical protein
MVTVNAATAEAQTEMEEQARAAFRLGRAHYDNGDFLKAAEQFEKAYRLSKKPELLYNIYVAYRDANMTRQAAEALRGYLTDANDIPNRGQLKSRLESLERAIAEEEQKNAAQPVPSAAPAPGTQTVAERQPAQGKPQSSVQTAAPSEPVAESQPQQPSETPMDAGGKGRPLTPFILMGVGGALVIGSIITGVMASSASSELKDKCPSKENCDPELKSTKSRGQALAVTTDIMLFGGIATAGVGVVLFFLQSPSESEPSGEPAPVALGCGPSGCYGSVRVAF